MTAARSASTAQLAELIAGLEDPALLAGDPFPLYARLRNEAPVLWNDAGGYWVLSKHDDVAAASADSDLFCSGRGILTFEIGTRYETPPTMMHTDPPAHTRYRKLVQPGFKPSVMRALEGAVRRRVGRLLEVVVTGEVVDVVPDLTVPLPLQIISELLGIPEEEWPRFFEWSEAAIPGATDWPEEKKAALQAEMADYFLAAARERRQAPEGEDIITVLANVSIDGEQLTDAELCMFLVQLLVAGNETTRNMLSGGLLALADDPGEWRRLVDRPALVPTAIEEMLRWTTPVIYFMRTATRDTSRRGQNIQAGDPVVLLYASANRDEDEFGPSAGRFDVGREPNHHLAFGFGAHFCVGAALARLEGKILLEELLVRCEGVERAGPVERTTSDIIAGVRAAPMILRPRSGR